MNADLQMLRHAKRIKTGHQSQKHGLNFPIPNLLLAIETQPQTEMRSTLRPTDNTTTILNRFLLRDYRWL